MDRVTTVTTVIGGALLAVCLQPVESFANAGTTAAQPYHTVEPPQPDETVRLGRLRQCDAAQGVACPATRIPVPDDSDIALGGFWSCRAQGTKHQSCNLELVTCADGTCAQTKPYCDDIFGVPCAYTTDVSRPEWVELIIGTYWRCDEWNDHEFCRIKIVVCDDEDPGFCTEL